MGKFSPAILGNFVPALTPFLDDTGGAAIVLCEDEQEANLVMERDPAVIDGIFVAEAHPWYLVEWARFGPDAQTGEPKEARWTERRREPPPSG